MTRCQRCDSYTHTCRDCGGDTLARSRLVAEIVVGALVVVAVFVVWAGWVVR